MDSSEIRRLEVKQSEVALQIRRESQELVQVQSQLNSANQSYLAQVKSFGEIQSRVEIERASPENPALRLQKVGYLKNKLLSEAREVQALHSRLLELEKAKSKVISQILVKRNRTEKIVELIQTKRTNLKTNLQSVQFEDLLESKVARRSIGSSRLKAKKEVVTDLNRKGKKTESVSDKVVHSYLEAQKPELELSLSPQIVNPDPLFNAGNGGQASNKNGQELLERIYDQIETIRSWKQGQQTGLSLNFSSDRGNMLGLEVTADDQQNLSIILSSGNRRECSILGREKSRVLKKLAEAGLKVKDVRVVEECGCFSEVVS